MRRHYDDRIVALSARLVVPFIQLYALYVIFHGHYSPGGGFQGGAVLAASFLLIRMSVGSDSAEMQFKRSWGTRGSSVGTLVFLGTGLLVMVAGAAFLDYAGLPLSGLDEPMRRSYGILIVEIGVAIAVASTLTAIYDDLVGEEAGPTEEEVAATEEAEEGLRA